MGALHPYLDTDGPIAFAHRGGTTHAPENTMAAFEAAVRLGYTHVETDVHATSDGVLVAFHDDDLRRTCDDPRSIATSSWAEVAECRVAGREPIPRLEELLDTWPDLRINIDCKTAGAVEPMIRLLSTRRDILERVCIGSFSDARLDAIRRALPVGLLSSMGPRAVVRMVARARALRVPLRRDGSRVAQVPVRQGPVTVVNRAFMREARRSGVHVHVWTVDDPAEIARLLDLGVDGIMSDDIVTLRDVMASRGLW